MSRFRCTPPFDGNQGRAQGTMKFQLLPLAFEGVREQLQLVKPLLKLRGGFCHHRAGGGSPTGLAPVYSRFFQEPGLGVMLHEEFGLGIQ